MPSTEALPASQDIEDYVSRLKAGLPDLHIDTLDVLGDGWDHVAIEANGIIFRLPKDHLPKPKREARVKYETAALKLLQPKLDVAIPDPKYVSKDYEFFGYPKLPGIIAYDAQSEMSQEQRDQYLRDWVRLAVAIHNAIPPEQGATLNVPNDDLARHLVHAEKIDQIETSSAQLLRFAQKTIAQARTVDFSKRSQVFLHNDFHSKNILLEPKTYRICGIIDWTDIKLGPPECELSVLEWGDGNDIEHAARLYGEQTGITIDIPMAKTIRHLIEIRDYVQQVQRGDKQGAMESKDQILKWAEQGR